MHSSLGSLAHSSMARSSLARSSMTEQEASEVELDAAADRALRAAYPSFRAASPGAPGGGGAGGAGGAGISRATPPGFDGLGRPSVGGSRMDRVSGASLGWALSINFQFYLFHFSMIQLDRGVGTGRACEDCCVAVLMHVCDITTKRHLSYV